MALFMGFRPPEFKGTISLKKISLTSSVHHEGQKLPNWPVLIFHGLNKIILNFCVNIINLEDFLM